MTNEIWKDIEGYKGHYQVSNMGNIKSLKRSKHLILKGTPNGNGYKLVGLYLNGVKYYPVHRLVALAFCSGYEKGLHVDHINGIKTDNRAINLRWVTHRQNREAYDPKRSKFGCGVQKKKDRKNYIARISMNGKHIHIGCYDTPEQARQARQDFKTKHNIK